MRAKESFTTFVKAALNFRCLSSPAYFEKVLGATIRLAQCKQSITFGSPVAMSGVMQSRQNIFLQRWHCRIYVVRMTLPQMPHSSFNANTQLKHALTYHAISEDIKVNLCFTHRLFTTKRELTLEISPPLLANSHSKNHL